MTRVCAWCPTPHEMGEVAPLEDRRVTHGMCEAAEKIANAKIDSLFEAAVAPTVASFFFDQHVVETQQIQNGLMTTPHHLAPIRPEWNSK